MRALTQEAFFSERRTFAYQPFSRVKRRIAWGKCTSPRCMSLLKQRGCYRTRSMGRNFWMPSVKTSKLTPNTTALDGRLKIIADTRLLTATVPTFDFTNRSCARE